jgi:hypothetical protein
MYEVRKWILKENTELYYANPTSPISKVPQVVVQQKPPIAWLLYVLEKNISKYFSWPIVFYSVF